MKERIIQLIIACALAAAGSAAFADSGPLSSNAPPLTADS